MTELQVKYKNIKRDKMINAIQEAIEEDSIEFECSGIQTEHVNTLALEKWSLNDPDAVVSAILGIVSDYLQEML